VCLQPLLIFFVIVVDVYWFGGIIRSGRRISARRDLIVHVVDDMVESRLGLTKENNCEQLVLFGERRKAKLLTCKPEFLVALRAPRYRQLLYQPQVLRAMMY
jgi:hypothetical protein